MSTYRQCKCGTSNLCLLNRRGTEHAKQVYMTCDIDDNNSYMRVLVHVFVFHRLVHSKTSIQSRFIHVHVQNFVFGAQKLVELQILYLKWVFCIWFYIFWCDVFVYLHANNTIWHRSFCIWLWIYIIIIIYMWVWIGIYIYSYMVWCMVYNDTNCK